MRYEIVKMGSDSFENKVPPSNRFILHMVAVFPLVSAEGVIIAIASLSEVGAIAWAMQRNTWPLSISDDTNHWCINNTKHLTQINGRPAAWVAWWDGHEDLAFFIDPQLVESDNFKLLEDDLGVFRIHDGNVFVISNCGPITEINTIVEAIK